MKLEPWTARGRGPGWWVGGWGLFWVETQTCQVGQRDGASSYPSCLSHSVFLQFEIYHILAAFYMFHFFEPRVVFLYYRFIWLLPRLYWGESNPAVNMPHEVPITWTHKKKETWKDVFIAISISMKRETWYLFLTLFQYRIKPVFNISKFKFTFVIQATFYQSQAGPIYFRISDM